MSRERDFIDELNDKIEAHINEMNDKIFDFVSATRREIENIKKEAYDDGYNDGYEEGSKGVN